ncbi:hypothetical protein [Methylocapsa acidiphila]|uniref:hypothetical protein n=1 Tax=Methylocapsa acidiphila TaxID=133552 RepID=UPI00041430CC|nr:hypothetical protein [Methylocapsa acidiphila]
MIAKALAQGFKILCYVALAVLAGSLAMVIILESSGLCSAINEGFATCKTPALETFAYTAGMIPVLSSFTLFPLVFAIGGLIFLLRGLIKRIWRHRTS